MGEFDKLKDTDILKKLIEDTIKKKIKWDKKDSQKKGSYEYIMWKYDIHVTKTKFVRFVLNHDFYNTEISELTIYLIKKSQDKSEPKNKFIKIFIKRINASSFLNALIGSRKEKLLKELVYHVNFTYYKDRDRLRQKSQDEKKDIDKFGSSGKSIGTQSYKKPDNSKPKQSYPGEPIRY